MKATRSEIAGLSTVVVEPEEAVQTIVFLHGFGAPGDDLVPFAKYLGLDRTRFVFPAAPIELGGLYGDSRAWWLIDMERLQRIGSGDFAGWMAEVPAGLHEVRATMQTFIGEIAARYPGPLVLGGFSQGAMLSLDTALHTDVPLSALVLMSATLIAEKDWQPRFKRLAGMRIVQSHGQFDQLLPYAIAETVRDRLTAAGANVEFHSFGGGHEIPPPVLLAIRAFLAPPK